MLKEKPDIPYSVKVIHVDDDHMMLDCTHRLLKKKGIWTYQLHHPQYGLKDMDDDILEDAVNLILSDGENVIEHVKRQRDIYRPTTPILIYSGCDKLVGAAEKTYGLPAVLKDGNFAELEKKIKQYASK